MSRVDYTGRTAAVTGAGSGIGRALAAALSARGASLAVCDVDMGALAGTADICRRSGVDVECYEVDVADRSSVLSYAEKTVERFGAVHLVVNNAGVAVAGAIADTPFEDIDWLLGINLMGVINGSKAFLPHLITSGDGHLVNVSSVFGLIAPAFNGIYSTSKFAVRGFTEALRQEMTIAGNPVTVHTVHPGGIRTNIVRHARILPEVEAATGGDPVKDFERIAHTSPERAASRILAGVDRNEARILVGPDAYLIAAIPRLLGGRYVQVFSRVGKRAAKRRGIA